MKKQLFPEPCSSVNVNDKKFTSDMESQTWTDVHGYGVQYVTFNMDFFLMIFVKNHALGNAIVSSLNHIAIFRIKVAQFHTLRYMVFKLLWSKY